MNEEAEPVLSMEPKKCELNIFLWGGIAMLAISVVFCFFYLQKFDFINKDSYEIINSHHRINDVTAVIDNLWFQNLDISISSSGTPTTNMQYNTDNVTRESNYLFAAILHTLLFIRRRGYNLKRPIYTHELRLSESDNYTTFTITVDELTYDFAYQAKLFYPILEKPENPTKRYISKIQLLASKLGNETVIYDNYQEYSDSFTGSCVVEILTTDAPVDVKFPGLDEATAPGVSLILVFLALISILVFFWYWWSVGFIKSARKIQTTFPMMNYYNRYH